MNNKVVITGYACGLGARNPDTRLGPDVAQERFNVQDPDSIEWGSIIRHDDSKSQLVGVEALETIVDCCTQLAQSVEHTIKQKQFPVVIGGDHSSAIGTWSGVAKAYQGTGELGIIWVDAHLDSHTMETSHSGCIHGMPIAALLGQGDQALTSIGYNDSKFKPGNLCFIGVRDFEEEELAFVKQHNIKVYYIEEVRQRGFEEIFIEALARLNQQCDYIGLSVDIDGLCPIEAPGTGTPVSNGISVKDFIQGIGNIKAHPKFCALEIVEYNPIKDIDDLTLQIVANIIEKTLDFSVALHLCEPQKSHAIS